METLAEENLVATRIALSAVSRAFAPLVRETRFPLSWDRDGGGGSNLRKLEGGENLEFTAAPDIDPFYRDSKENRQFGAQKSKSLWGQVSGRVPPPLAFSTF